jgi:hypothetical protein
MKMRMSMMRNRGEGGLGTGAETAPNKQNNDNHAGSSAMNTSFSAMNNSLSQKWMNKKN